MPSIATQITKNWIPFKGTPDTHSSNRSTKVDPALINYMAKTGEARGYGREFPVALSGAETTFGTFGYGPGNPMSFGFTSEQERDAAEAKSKHLQQLKETIAAFKSQGMPQEDLDSLYTYARHQGVRPFTAIDLAFDRLDEKKDWLRRKNKPITPANLAWVYQGTGVPNKREIPNRIAYGKPVERTHPQRGHAAVVVQILKDLAKPDNKLGQYLREGF